MRDALPKTGRTRQSWRDTPERTVYRAAISAGYALMAAAHVAADTECATMLAMDARKNAGCAAWNPEWEKCRGAVITLAFSRFL